MVDVYCPKLLHAGKPELSISPNVNVIKYFFVIMLCCSVNALSFSQMLNEPVGLCFEKSNRKAIEKRIEKLKIRASKEMNRSIDSISYIIEKKYTYSYTKECKHLPEIITFQTRGQKKTYRCSGMSGLVGYWILASWIETNIIIIDL